ncbi:MAG: acyltransferase, partial [Nitrososphaera sp.]|nr:acyltransferase [Nitrososphaera sp.]
MKPLPRLLSPEDCGGLGNREHPKTRLATLDAMRFMAAVAVIWLHTSTSPESDRITMIGRFAVPFFIAAALFLTCEKALKPNGPLFRQFVVDRFHRLYLPFLVWSAIYFLVRMAAARFVTHAPEPEL